MTSHHMFDSWDKNLQKSRFSKKKKFPPEEKYSLAPQCFVHFENSNLLRGHH